MIQMRKTTNMMAVGLCSLLMGCQGNFDARLQEEAQAYTAEHCPQSLDEMTTLDSVSYLPATRVYTKYFSVTAEAAVVITQHPAEVRASLLQTLRNDATCKACKDKDVTFCYVYHTVGTPSPVYTVTFSQKDYAAHESR